MKNLDLLSDNFLESILIEPVKSGADSLRIISSYAKTNNVELLLSEVEAESFENKKSGIDFWNDSI